MKNENIDTKRKKFEEWREHQAWYIVSKDGDDKSVCRLMNIAAAQAWDAALASQQVAEPVAWQYRWTNPGDNKGVSENELKWEKINLRGLQTMRDAVVELEASRYNCKPCYEVRALYAAPTTPPLVQQSFWQVSIDENGAPRRLKLKIGNQTFHIDAQDEQDELSRVDWYEKQLVAAMQRLTTATPQRMPLTDEQVEAGASALVDSCIAKGHWPHCKDDEMVIYRTHVRAVLNAAHGISASDAQEVAK